MLIVGQVEVICPACRSELHSTESGACCSTGHGFPRLYSTVDFLGGNEASDTHLEISIDHSSEASSAEWRVKNYLIPNLEAMLGGTPAYKVLDDGCGVGTVVTELARAGMDAYGIDPGSRVREWESSGIADRLFRADGASLPFRDATFDAVVSSGVLEHLGEPLPWPERLPTQVGYIREALRVLKPGGVAIMAAPNGAHPIDYWHSRKLKAVEDTTSPMRLHLPYERWMPNARRVRRWVAASGYEAEVTFLSPEDYLAFERVRRHWAGRLFTSTMRAIFRAITRHPALAGSVVNPWLVVSIRRL